MAELKYKHDGYTRIREIYFAMCKSVDSPVSLGAWIRFKEGEFQQLAEMNIEPDDYQSARSFALDYSVIEYLSKNKFLDCGVDKREAAILSFNKREETNKSLNELWRDTQRTNPAERLILRAQRIVSRVLGHFSFEQLLDGCRWGRGSTATLPLRRAYLEDKYLEQPGISVTRSAAPYFLRLFSEDIHWLNARGIPAEGPVSLLNKEEHFQIVEGCVITTVGKNCLKDRTIAKEPTGNLFLQFGVGAHIRERLFKVLGIDLSSQVKNQKAAEAGWATIDLKDASNSLFRELVGTLLPLDWFMYLDRIRSSHAVMPDKSVRRLEMFSSMGNGFTFELETLLFAAISIAAVEESQEWSPVLVYGDDIATLSSLGPVVVKALESFGFTVNTKKTHVSGPFRESCGRHFFNNVEVTPVYQKEIPLELHEVYRCYNRLIRLSLRLSRVNCRDSVLRGAALAALRGIEVRHATAVTAEDDGVITFRGDPWEGPALSKRYSFRPRPLATVDSVRLAYTLRFGVAPLIRGPLNVWRMLRAVRPGQHVGKMVTSRRSFRIPTDRKSVV